MTQLLKVARAQWEGSARPEHTKRESFYEGQARATPMYLGCKGSWPQFVEKD